MAAPAYFYALGRRKSSTARVRLSTGKGSFTINDKSVADYFAGSKHIEDVLVQPFKALDLDAEKHIITARVSGGGHSAQADAIQLGIAKALVVLNEDYRATLRKAELLGRDPRDKERKKFGLKGARKQRQFTKR